MSELDAKIAFAALSAHSPLLRSQRLGFAELGIHPAHLVLVSPRERLLAEWRRYRLGVVSRTLAPTAQRALARRADAARPAAPTEPVLGPEPAVTRVRRLNSDETVALVRRLGIRYLVNAGAGIFRSPLVDLEDVVIVNAHAGALPGYRNMNVVEWALLNGEPVVGTVHRIDGGIDTGPVLLSRTLDLDGVTSVSEARDRAFDQVGRLVAEAVVEHAAGRLVEQPQPSGGRRWYVMHPAFTRALDERLRRPPAG